MKYVVKLEAHYSRWKSVEANSKEEALEKGEALLREQRFQFWNVDRDFYGSTDALPCKG